MAGSFCPTSWIRAPASPITGLKISNRELMSKMIGYDLCDDPDQAVLADPDVKQRTRLISAQKEFDRPCGNTHASKET